MEIILVLMLPLLVVALITNKLETVDTERTGFGAEDDFDL